MHLLKSIFVGPNGVRAGWRALLYLVGAMAVQLALQLVVINGLGYKPAEGFDPLDFLVSDGVGIVAVLVTVLVAARLERRRLSDYYLTPRAAFGARYWEGWLWGFGAVAVLMAAIVAAGGATISGFALHGNLLLRYSALWLASMIVLGIFEEFAFRGYLLASLSRGLGFWWAAILTSAFFGALHYFTKPMENWADALSVSLLGLFLCASIARTGDLWLAAGFHAAFDFFALGVLGAPNTGNNGKPIPNHLLAVQFHGPDWITGGVRGIEASLLIFPVIAVLFALLEWRFRSRSVAR